MKKIVALLMLVTVIMSCKDDKKTDIDTGEENQSITAKDGKTSKQNDGLIAIQGEFLYSKVDNAAVLKTPTQMYGVVLDKKMMELQKQIESYKVDEYTMVPVTLRGRIIKNEKAENEWKNKIEIKEILKISKPAPEESDIIKLGSK
nr:hypothetical protein [uncultured Psychroserpens sp.]